MEQISEGGRSIHEIEKQRKRLETEKFEFETALGDAESALEQEENKLLRLSLEVNQVRADIEKRIQEKEEEFEGITYYGPALAHVELRVYPKPECIISTLIKGAGWNPWAGTPEP